MTPPYFYAVLEQHLSILGVYMPVIFSTPTSHRVFMFDKDASLMLKAMKTSGNIPGALFPEAVPDALSSLQERVQIESNDEDESSAEDNNYVGIQKKATPLIELMERAINQNEKLLWEQG